MIAFIVVGDDRDYDMGGSWNVKGFKERPAAEAFRQECEEEQRRRYAEFYAIQKEEVAWREGPPTTWAKQKEMLEGWSRRREANRGALDPAASAGAKTGYTIEELEIE